MKKKNKLVLAKRSTLLADSVTLDYFEKTRQLKEMGKYVYEFTHGQFPYKPASFFIENIYKELNFLSSFQYSPVSGIEELRKKFLHIKENDRDISLNTLECNVHHGGKQALFNALACLIDKGDEVILLTPIWPSYLEMIKFLEGVPLLVPATSHGGFIPSISEIEKLITDKTKAIIVNSPNNPAGVHYDEAWMRDFAQMVAEYPQVFLISDEVYSKIVYYDPKPSYFYQFDTQLLERTIIIDSISKMFASAGLRLGFSICPPELSYHMKKFQSQTTSGPNSLIQNAILNTDFELFHSYLNPILSHIRRNADYLMEALHANQLGALWYQTQSAFYFTLDFHNTRYYQTQKNKNEDLSVQLSTQLLEQCYVATVPGNRFGVPNSLRLSLLEEKEPFQKGIDLIIDYLNKPFKASS